MKQFLSRKFLLTLGTVASATWLVAAGHISDGVYSAVVIAVVTGYHGANVIQKTNTKAA